MADEINNEPFGVTQDKPFDRAPFDQAPFDNASLDEAPFDSAQGKQDKSGRAGRANGSN